MKNYIMALNDFFNGNNPCVENVFAISRMLR